MKYFFILLGLVLLSTMAVFLNLKTESNILITTSTTIIQSTAPSITQSSQNIPILMYHYIRDYNNTQDKIGQKLSVSPKVFEQQIKWLKENGYETIALNEFMNYKVKKPIILTFDDGYADAYTQTFPLLKKYNFRATFFVMSDYLNGGWYLTKEQVKEMDQAGMVIGSHTKNHLDLEKASPEKQRNEILESKKRIEEIVGHKITDFCYPSGKYNQETIKILKENGFENAVTVQVGIAKNTDNIFELPRLRMENNTDLAKILK